jgi:hypothetical protein
VEEVAEHDAPAEMFLQGEVNILLQAMEGGDGVSSAKFLLIVLEGYAHRGREHLAFLRAQAKTKGIIPQPVKEEFPKAQDVARRGNNRRVGRHGGKRVGLPSQKPGGCADCRGGLAELALEVSNFSVRLPKRLVLRILIITIIVIIIIIPRISSQTDCIFASLPKLCTGLEEALLLRTGAAQGA